MNFARFSIGGKILAITLGIVALGLGSLTLVLSEQHRSESEEGVRQRSLVLAHSVAQYAIAPLLFEDQEGGGEILQTLDEHTSVQSAVLLDASGRTFATFSRSGTVPSVRGRSGRGFAFERDELLVWEPVIEDGRRLGSLELSISTLPLAARQQQITWNSLAIASGLVLVCAVLAFWLSRFVTRPLAELADTMQGITSAGSLETRVEHDRTDELGRIYDVFNAMMSELEQRQRGRQLSETRLRSLVEALPDLVFIVDAAGLVIEVPNPDEVRLTLDGASATGKSIDALFDPEAAAAIRRAMERAVEGGVSQHVTFSVGPTETARQFDAIVNPMNVAPFAVGEGAVFVVVARDVTENQRLQAQLQQAQKMEAIGQLAGGVAHDFNNLLAGIMGYAEVLRRKGDGPNRDKYLAEILAICQRAADLNANLLAFSRRSPSRMAPLDLHSTIDRVVGIIAHSFDRRIEVVLDLAAESSMVSGDASQLESAILNLAVNARDAMPDGGTLRFSSRVVALDDVELGTLTGPVSGAGVRYVELSVSDTGTGIPDHVRQRMFEPFFTTKALGKGSGLGLAAVYGTVQSHRGVIRVYSQLGEGTVFRLYFPLVEGSGATAGLEAAETEAKGSGLVLVVDDEDYIRETTKLVLEGLGYEVVVANGGPEAISIFRDRHHELAAVMLDMVMPVMTGAEVADELSKMDADVPVVICSGFDLRSGGRRSLVRAAAFLQKPFARAEIAATLASVITRAATGRGRSMHAN